MADQKATADFCFKQTSSIPASSKSAGRIVPTDRDIICSKDKTFAKHPGNIWYREYIESKVEVYLRADSRAEKIKLTREMVKHIMVKYGGRFLKRATLPKNDTQNDGRMEWEEISPLAARDKVSHAIRFATQRLTKFQKAKHFAADTDLKLQTFSRATEGSDVPVQRQRNVPFDSMKKSSTVEGIQKGDDVIEAPSTVGSTTSTSCVPQSISVPLPMPLAPYSAQTINAAPSCHVQTAMPTKVSLMGPLHQNDLLQPMLPHSSPETGLAQRQQSSMSSAPSLSFRHDALFPQPALAPGPSTEAMLFEPRPIMETAAQRDYSHPTTAFDGDSGMDTKFHPSIASLALPSSNHGLFFIDRTSRTAQENHGQVEVPSSSSQRDFTQATSSFDKLSSEMVTKPPAQADSLALPCFDDDLFFSDDTQPKAAEESSCQLEVPSKVSSSLQAYSSSAWQGSTTALEESAAMELQSNFANIFENGHDLWDSAPERNQTECLTNEIHGAGKMPHPCMLGGDGNLTPTTSGCQPGAPPNLARFQSSSSHEWMETMELESDHGSHLSSLFDD